MFGKKKMVELKPVRKTIFSIPSEQAKPYLSSIIKDVKAIMDSDKFMEATHKVEVPENATIKDFEHLVKKVAPAKIYAFLSLFIDDCYDEVRRILSAVFVTDFEAYKNKSINEICEDLYSLNNDEIIKLLRFFIH